MSISFGTDELLEEFKTFHLQSENSMALSQISSEIFNIDFESDEQKFWDALARLLHQIESQVSFEE